MEPDRALVDEYLRLVGEVEVQLGLPPNQLFMTVAESEWAMVIKLNAIVEAALSDAIRSHVSPAGAAEWIVERCKGSVRLAIDVVSALDLLPAELTQRLRALARLRNAAAHGAQGLRFSFSDYFAVAENRNNFEGAFGSGATSEARRIQLSSLIAVQQCCLALHFGKPATINAESRRLLERSDSADTGPAD